MMRLLLFGTVLVALALPSRADEEFDTLLADFEKAQQEFYAAITKMEEEGGSLEPGNLPAQPSETFAPKFEAYAKQHEGSPEAIPALAWMLQDDFTGDSAKAAIELLGKHHAGDPQMASVLQGLEWAAWRMGAEPVVSLCEKILEKNKTDDVRAGAMFVLGATLMSEFGPDAKPDAKRAEKTFRELIKAYPDSDAAKRAGAYIFEIERLQVGMKAPEIVGQALDGAELKLSQYLGQVVVLDFWGFW